MDKHNVLFVGKYNNDLVRSNTWSLFLKQLHNIITPESLQNVFLKYNFLSKATNHKIWEGEDWQGERQKRN